MKKKILTLVAMATLVTMMTACGNAETTNSTVPTEVPTVTETPVETTTPTVEPTEAPEVTVEPTEAPEEITTAPTEAPEVTVEPTEAPTEAPTVTVEPTVAPAEPTEVPEITEAPVEETTEEPAGNPADVAEDPNFEEIKNMVKKHISRGKEDKYSDIEAIIETMDTTRYEVTAVDSLDPVLKEDITDEQRKWSEDAFNSCEGFKLYYVWTDDSNFIEYKTAFTGEFYFMTLTDLVTDETIVWGLRVHLEDTNNPGTYFVREYSMGVMGYFGSMYLKEQYN